MGISVGEEGGEGRRGRSIVLTSGFALMISKSFETITVCSQQFIIRKTYV
jgi:hypothetical protein